MTKRPMRPSTATPPSALDLMRRIQRLAEVARVMGDARTAAAMQALADRLWQDARAGALAEETVREARRLAA